MNVATRDPARTPICSPAGGSHPNPHLSVPRALHDHQRPMSGSGIFSTYRVACGPLRVSLRVWPRMPPGWIGVEVVALSRQTRQPLRPASTVSTVARPRDFGNRRPILMFACRPETWGGVAPWHREDRNLAHERTIRINRAPVLTLWGAVVAERLGFDPDAALTLGRALAGLNAYSKGVSLGLFEPSKKAVDEHLQKAKAGTTLHVDLMHRAVPVTSTAEGLRALSKDRPITPASVERYLGSKFGENLSSARRAMAKLANSLPPAEIAARAYRLYEEFRPAIPAGVKGWGVAGELDLDLIEGLSER